MTDRAIGWALLREEADDRDRALADRDDELVDMRRELRREPWIVR